MDITKSESLDFYGFFFFLVCKGIQLKQHIMARALEYFRCIKLFLTLPWKFYMPARCVSISVLKLCFICIWGLPWCSDKQVRISKCLDRSGLQERCYLFVWVIGAKRGAFWNSMSLNQRTSSVICSIFLFFVWLLKSFFFIAYWKT